MGLRYPRQPQEPGQARCLRGESALGESTSQDETSNPSVPRAARSPGPPWLLFLGAATGLALAAFGLLETRSDSQALAANAAARVGERTIRRIAYERVLAGVEGDRRNPIDEATRRRVLARMIDEELLVQRALELGLAAIDRRVRGELTSGLIDSIVSEADAEPASENEVARHFEENVNFFSRPGRLHAETLFFSTRSDGRRPDASAKKRASEALTRLRQGDETSQVEASLGDVQISPIPAGMLPATKIRDYVGPIVLRALEDLETGSWSNPIASGSGIYLARVVDREARIVPVFKEVEGLVRQDLRRRRGDEALRRYLDELRTQKSVVIDETLFRDGG